MKNNNLDENGALTREFLLTRGRCCKNGCRNCPYGYKKQDEMKVTVEFEMSDLADIKRTLRERDTKPTADDVHDLLWDHAYSVLQSTVGHGKYQIGYSAGFIEECLKDDEHE